MLRLSNADRFVADRLLCFLRLPNREIVDELNLTKEDHLLPPIELAPSGSCGMLRSLEDYETVNQAFSKRLRLLITRDLGSWFIFQGDARTVFDSDSDSLWRQMIQKTELKLAGSDPHALERVDAKLPLGSW